jgi:hypothetical protein
MARRATPRRLHPTLAATGREAPIYIRCISAEPQAKVKTLVNRNMYAAKIDPVVTSAEPLVRSVRDALRF